MDDKALTELLQTAKTIAIVGASNTPGRASLGVSRFLQRMGYRVIPVNPNETEVLGERAYPSVRDIPEQVDIVDIFRRPARVPEVVEQALEKGTRCIWMQEGVINEQAKRQAEAGGIPVVMDRCILKEISRLLP
ncbi:MAG: CoA-binding protein [Acidobacteriaceae bacterium]|nr:CoA-binding protein [Acidobacteriaceae bacterium]